MRNFTAILAVCVLVAVSCTTEEICVESPQAYLRAGFYRLVNGEEKDTALKDLSVFGISREDSLIYDEDDNVGSVTLPLSALAGSCSYVFCFSIPDTVPGWDTARVIDHIGSVFEPDTVFLPDTFRIVFLPVPDTVWRDSVFQTYEVVSYILKDTLTVSYQPWLTLVSEACGFTSFFDITAVASTHQVISTTALPEPAVTLTEDEHIKIYF